MEWILIVILVLVVVLLLSNRATSKFSYRLNGPLFSAAERSFYGVLNQAIADDYVIFGKVRVADIVLPKKGLNKSQWQIAFNKISSKHFDFVLCQKADLKVVAAIELDDKSHGSKKAKKRDELLGDVCDSAGLTLIRFVAKRGYQIDDVRIRIKEVLVPST